MKNPRHKQVTFSPASDFVVDDPTNSMSGDGSLMAESSSEFVPSPGEKWYCSVPAASSLSSAPNSHPSVPIASLKQKAETLLMNDVHRYKAKQARSRNRKDFAWLQTVLSSGTLEDKVAAHTILIQESAIHHLNSLDTLIDMVNIKGKRECIMAMDVLQELFINDLLPENRKLKKFEQQPLSSLESVEDPQLKNKILIHWYFEDQLKVRYEKFVKALECVSRDTVEKTKEKSAAVMYKLLAGSPEQEQYLLEKLVNKLGDPTRKVASKVSYLLSQLVLCRPVMKKTVVDEVERMMYRPNVGERAQYCALCFLHELVLSPDDDHLASQLVNVYFSFFKASVKKGEVDTKIMKALLMGVRRAYPYLKDKQELILDRLEMMFRVVHLVSFNISVQALLLIFQVLESRHDISDRFYSVLYRKLLDQQFEQSPHKAMLFNLLCKALKKDHQVERVKAFIKRLLQICDYLAPPTVCGILMLLSEIQKSNPSLLDVKACSTAALDDDDDEERFQDLDDDDEDNNASEQCSKMKATGDEDNHVNLVTSSWVHVKVTNDGKNRLGEYDPHHRNPLFARAGLCPAWELHHLSKHYHPSAALFAQQLRNKQGIDYSGDPLQDFTLIHFLDRFVFRNPKKVSSSADSQKVFSRQKKYVPAGVRQLQPNTPQYLNQKIEKIPLEERFLFNYLRQRQDKKLDDESDIESVASDEFERFLDGLEGNEDVNFADEFDAKKGKQKKKQNGAEDSEEDEEQEFDDEDAFISEDEEIEFDEDEFKGEFDEFDEDLDEAFVGGDDAERMEGEVPGSVSQKRSKHSASKKGGKKAKDKYDVSKIFADAEEFSHLLDENVGSKINSGSLQALSNKDKASEKQLLWEMQRDRWIRNDDWRKKKGKGASDKGGKKRKMKQRKFSGNKSSAKRIRK